MLAPPGDKLVDYDRLTAQIKQLTSAEKAISVNPMIEGQVLASTELHASGALVRGMRADDFAARKLLSDHIVAGSLGDFRGDGIIVGKRSPRTTALKSAAR